MLGYVEGKVKLLFPESDKFTYLVVEPQKGVGYSVLVPNQTVSRLGINVGSSVTLYVYTYVTQKEMYSLGISDANRFRFFLRFIRLSGVGPKLAALLVEHFESFEELLEALGERDVDRLAKVPGLGRKKASRIILNFLDTKELSQFVGALHEGRLESTAEREIKDMLISVLTNLGLSKQEATAKVKERMPQVREYLRTTKRADMQELIKLVLRRV